MAFLKSFGSYILDRAEEKVNAFAKSIEVSYANSSIKEHDFREFPRFRAVKNRPLPVPPHSPLTCLAVKRRWINLTRVCGPGCVEPHYRARLALRAYISPHSMLMESMPTGPTCYSRIVTHNDGVVFELNPQFISTPFDEFPETQCSLTDEVEHAFTFLQVVNVFPSTVQEYLDAAYVRKMRADLRDQRRRTTVPARNLVALATLIEVEKSTLSTSSDYYPP
jgi:hypothetical protein